MRLVVVAVVVAHAKPLVKVRGINSETHAHQRLLYLFPQRPKPKNGNRNSWHWEKKDTWNDRLFDYTARLVDTVRQYEHLHPCTRPIHPTVVKPAPA